MADERITILVYFYDLLYANLFVVSIMINLKQSNISPACYMDFFSLACIYMKHDSDVCIYMIY